MLFSYSSESLAGRIAYHQLFPIGLIEIPDTISQNDLWVKGGFPNMLFAEEPQLSKGNFQAFDDLKSPVNYVITPSSDDFLMKENIRVCSLRAFLENYVGQL